MHIDLIKTQDTLYTPVGFMISNLSIAAESQEYGACTFHLNDLKIIFRTAKITPTKIGLFVAIWKRVNGITQPLDKTDNFDFLIISVKNKNYFGQFVFPKSILIDKGIVSTTNKEGKRGIRVYPSWDTPDNKQALDTKTWQSKYFMDLSKSIDLHQAKKLYKK
jgi:hypothetical protein